MTKVISIQAKKMKTELKSYAEELKTIDRLLARHQHKERVLLKNRLSSQERKVKWWNLWNMKWKK